MTPDERNLIADLFDRLATLENSARDPDAERVIKEGQRQAPNAIYALVQTALVQDEALKRADARIHELEDALGMSNEPVRPAGFLDNMRNALFGRQEPPPRAGSVPSVPMGGPDGYRPGMAPGYGQMGPGQMGPGQMGPGPGMEPGRPGGSFLGTAAAAAAGAIGGSMMLDGIRSMMGHQRPGAGVDGGGGAGTTHAAAGSPWSSGSSAGGGDLARQAGLDDIGRSSSSGAGNDGGAGRGQGLLNTKDDLANDDLTHEELADDDFQDLDDGDFDGGDDGGGSED